MIGRSILGRKSFRVPLPALVLAAVLLLLAADGAWSHEFWVLTPEQIAEVNAQPVAQIFTEFNATNISMIVVTMVFLVAWVLLGFTGARELFPDLQVRLASYAGFAALALRIGLAVMLGMAAFGLAPRVGTEIFEAPVLGAPDLELRLVHPFWIWIAWAEAGVAAAFLLGIYVRAAAAVTLVIGGLGLVLFGTGMVAYIGLVGGAAIYLLLQGAGSFYVPLPAFPGTRRITRWLADQPRARAQVLLRVLAGLNLMYLGIDFKLLQPNLAVAMIVEHQVPTFGMETATFVLWMALVETLSGALILAGILIRPLAFFLILSFLFFSLLMGESVFSHIIFYALLVSFVTNAAGRWRRPIATDRPGKILILGGGFAGVHCALRLERLLGRFTNVEVTLVHRESYFQFHPLLLEVVGGTIQPGNIVNPIRRICTRTQFFHGEATSIDTDARQASVALISGEEITLGYDQLVVALEWEADFSGIPGLADHAHP
ncbi:MAG: FAD-dependent oxidoreductase, partial [SAR324 cluster bacterium]|nr:FAD-dependent oxidoreductase [SAR324 cluster bacterium]